MVSPPSPVTSKSSLPLVHVAAWIQSIGGVETLLAHHRRRDAAAGLAATQIALFDQTGIPGAADYATQRFGGWHTPRQMRRAMQNAFGSRPDATVLYHNGWGLPWFADTDQSRRRIVCWWDSQTHWGPWLEAVKPWVDGVICMSDAAAADLAARWPNLPPERCGVMRVPIETPTDLPAGPKPKKEWVIGCAGRLVRAQKRADRLVPFVAALRALDLPYRIEVVSDGPLRRELQAALGRDARVEFLGWQSGDAYWRRMQAWDAMVSFTDHEGGPIVMLEAMAAGVLPVFPDIGGSLVRDYLPSLSEHCVYPPGDVTAAAQRMQALWQLDDATTARLQAGARRVAESHTGERYHAAFTAFVQRIDALPRRSRPATGSRGSRWADLLPLGALTRLAPGTLWR